MSTEQANLAYADLQKRISAAGLYERTYGYYAVYAAFVLVGVVCGLYLITVTTNPWFQSANALFLSFVLVQGGMLGHDFSHQQVFTSYRVNRFFAIIMWSLFGGLSESKWYEKHNAHHTHVNHLDLDPDLGIPFLFSEVQVPNRSKLLKRFILPHQEVLFFCALPLVYLNFFVRGMLYIFKNISLRSLFELALVVIHFSVLLWLLFTYLPVYTATLFLVINLLAGGAYMSLVFAPNHKGKEVVTRADTVWTDQITLTRNLRPSWPTFLFSGGLNFQIEHHLFSNMSRLKYWQAHPIVKQYCAENGLPYHEASWSESFVQMYYALKHVRESSS